MSFWQLTSDANAPALFCKPDDAPLNYAGLAALAEDFAQALPASPTKQLGLLLCQNDAPTLAAYLAALRHQQCVALLPERLPAQALDTLINCYAPDWVLIPHAQPCPAGMQLKGMWHGKNLYIRQSANTSEAIFPDTAVLLSTSGTTGNPKMVRLSYRNIASNAESIAAYLEINAQERAIASLPMHYSYGLSIINSHLAKGAAIALTDEAVTTRGFWELFRHAGVTSLAGVPMMWQMLQRLRLERMDLPTLKTLTQAGGRLSPELIRHFAQICQNKGWRFFVMYGQTEASPRISYVPWPKLADKIGSIGIAIPGGELSLSTEGELIYRGDNVMLGYAECRADLSRGDEMKACLHTGDLARVDEDGYYWLTGRSKRIAKVFGNRINLDEIEALLEEALHAPVATLDGDDHLQIVLTPNGDTRMQEKALDLLRAHLSVHPSALEWREVASLPLNSRGKKDYASLRSLFAPA